MSYIICKLYVWGVICRRRLAVACRSTWPPFCLSLPVRRTNYAYSVNCKFLCTNCQSFNILFLRLLSHQFIIIYIARESPCTTFCSTHALITTNCDYLFNYYFESVKLLFLYYFKLLLLLVVCV